jgi:hypothetical protein
MNHPQRFQQGRPAARPQSNGRMKEQRAADYAAPAPEGRELSLDQIAGIVARRIIKESSVDDTTANWRALKRAYLAGYEDAQR